jgi:poly(3-hydroxybutyrate) depolymerase
VADESNQTKVLTVRYRAWNGAARTAYVLMPGDVRPGHAQALPLVISPHGRNSSARANAGYWGNLPAEGRFAVVNPMGQGRRLKLCSWGWRRQVDDLLRMPSIVEVTLPWLRVDERRIFVMGSSMGGQETLLVVARKPRWLRGAAALDSATDMPRRYHDFGLLANGADLQRKAREEIGGTPRTNPVGYALRSPVAWAKKIAFSGIPLQIWWSTADQIVRNQDRQSQALYDHIVQLNPHAKVKKVVGDWPHSHEFRSTQLLPQALRDFGLLPPDV